MSRRGPVLIADETAGPATLSPDTAPPVPDPDLPFDRPDGRAMRAVAGMATARRTWLGRWFWRSLGALALFLLGVAGWAVLDALVARSLVLGWIAVGLTALFLLSALGLCLREFAALMRLARVGDIQRDAEAALASGDLAAARAVSRRLVRLYEGREALAWGRARLAERDGDMFDADTVLSLTETELLRPLDEAARLEIEAAARQVAAVTAIVPLALADVASAAVSNLRMIRRIAEIYGGRAGTVGALRLTRSVFAHLVATGAVAVGDDLIGSVAGGSMLARVSRRFGEGIVNGALTARVGVAAMEVCRPMPFSPGTRPQVHKLIGRALSGLFPTGGAAKAG
ncbi:TIGR01620 family protein [Palleronia sediminis]|uniref:TIGR01620 family protein n=1 Tax=Palleronia sediminis TaxID=2547833 RepID=A0A4R6A276_9RHOB|nr:TIGR01620 family protein [Palleronia sediminis]TDL76028.1 TIGR01620 family protein [Palleronia sediminis]